MNIIIDMYDGNKSWHVFWSRKLREKSPQIWAVLYLLYSEVCAASLARHNCCDILLLYTTENMNKIGKIRPINVSFDPNAR